MPERSQSVGLTIELAGQAAKRGLVPRLPAVDRLASEIEGWLRDGASETVRAISAHGDGNEQVLLVDLHPAARPVRIAVGDGGSVRVAAPTAGVGPGYQRYVARLLDRLGTDAAIGWLDAPDGDGDGEGAATGPADGLATAAGVLAAQRTDVERAHLRWLRAALERVRAARARGAGGIHLGTPPGVRFTFEGAFASPLGPRDDAWLETAIGDARVAADVWPWFADAMDARHLLNRALTLMWTEVRWRPPALAEEIERIDEALGLLKRAYPLEPSLPYPYREWRELFALRGASDPSVRELLDRAAGASPGELASPAEPIGYRRDEVTVLHHGWALPVAGSFAERRTDEEWWGGEQGRSITLAATETGAAGAPMSPEAFLDEVVGDLGDGSLEHRDGALLGRARLATDGSSGVEVAEVEGFAAVTGSGAAIRIVFDDPGDWKWALDAWRSLRPARTNSTLEGLVGA